MFEPRTILCPLDFSPPSQMALAAGADLAGQYGASLILLHSVPPIPPLYGGGVGVNGGFDTGLYLEEMRTGSQKALEQEQAKLPAGLESRIVLADGDPAGEICRVAALEGADLIVIATHGQTGWRRLVFGSVTERVVRLAPCPVLTIPAREATEL